MIRLDKRGRRIGYNWWREYNTDLLSCAAAAWEKDCEAEALGYATETAEYEAAHPRPNLRQFLETNAGMSRGEAA